MPRQRGFTLVEVLIAMFIMALMAAMAWQGIDGISRTRNASQQRLDQTLRINTVLAQWEQDLAMVQNVQAVPPLGFDGASLRLVRTTPNGLQVVVWTLRGRSLWRWNGTPQIKQKGLQDSWFQSNQLLGNEPASLRMLEGALRWQLYCWRGNSWSNCQSSGDVAPEAPSEPSGNGSNPPQQAAPQPTQTPPPQGVRLVLTLANGEGEFNLTRDIMLGPQEE